MHNGKRAAPRCAALVGPYLSGKTSLMESLLLAAGAIQRKGGAGSGDTVGDASAEAKARRMTVEMGVASLDYLGDRWHLIDCPGSIELMSEACRALMVADVAVVVCEPVPDKALMLAPLFKFLDDNAIPHMLFINKVDQLGAGGTRIRDLMQALQAVSQRPLVLREVPIRDGQDVTGYVDLVSERAYRFKPGQASDLVQMPETVRDREREARQEMLEALADFDDGLLEKLLEDVAPDRNEIYRQLAADLAQDLIVPVFLGSAERDHGVRRLLKALRHETPEPAATAERLGIPEGGSVAQVAKVLHTPHTGRLSLSRVWRGQVADGMCLGGEKVSGLFALFGGTVTKIAGAQAGDLVALGKLEKARAGDVLTDKGQSIRAAFWPDAPEPVHAIAVQAEQRTDEVKLTAAIHKLVDEDPSLTLHHRAETAEMVLCGQGPVHLGIAADRLRNRHNVPVRAHAPVIPYRETIRKGTELHSRFKRQTGGHGQFADVHVAVRPLPRGSGFQFKDAVVGGAVPRQFIPAVEEGCREALASGPMGFPVVDLEVTLTGGQYHAVDSSEQAFRTVGRQALQEALGKCEPVLLEPIMLVNLSTPTEFTARVQRLASGRRGQILGFDVRPGWAGWDEVKVYMPQADMADLIIELRSITLGLGSYTAVFDHLQELTGRLADRVAELRQAGVAAQ